MNGPVSEAKARLTELVRRAEAGEDVVLTRHGQGTVRPVPVKRRQCPDERQRIMAGIQARARGTITAGPSAARNQDFLYDDDGLPR